MSTAETEEKARLEDCQTSPRNALAHIDTRLGDYAQEIQTRSDIYFGRSRWTA